METIIVPVRAVNFELPELMKGIYEQLEQSLKEKAQKALNQKLVEKVSKGLGREFHQRRHKTKGGRGLMQCHRCGTRFWRQFSRNGYRSRYLELALGRLEIELPRVRCQCGGSVGLNLEGLKPWQRWGDDVEQLIQYYSALGHSLRQIQQQLQESWPSGIGLSSLNNRLKPLAQPLLSWQKQPLSKTPPVVLLDAIWVKLLIETELIKKDKRGRRRVVKKRVKRPVLIALGVWPEEGFYQVCRAWQATQPEAVATLQRDFQDTLTFYFLQAQNRLWPAHLLRTTSLLERLNRKIRARLRKAGAFHSLSGLLVCLSFLFPISPPP